MQVKKLPEDPLVELGWIAKVRDVHLPLGPTVPVIARDIFFKDGLLAGRSKPRPERHSYYEINFILEGHLITHIGREKIKRGPGSLMLIGPGIPHDALHEDYPYRGYAVHFLPILLLEMGPQGDGSRVLARFAAAQKISDRIFPAPRHLIKGLTEQFEAMSKEFQEKRSCWELRLRALLMEILTEIVRWEESSGRFTELRLDETNWMQMEKSLRFIHDNFARPFYVGEMARAVSLSVDRLQTMFRKAYGIGCLHYLLAYRVAQSKAMLCAPGSRVNEVAQEVGFNSLSHFCRTFRRLTGISPTEYIRRGGNWK